MGLARNFCGVARDTELLFDFGTAVREVTGNALGAKRFKGSLEVFFAEQKKKQEAREAAESAEEPAAKRARTEETPTPVPGNDDLPKTTPSPASEQPKPAHTSDPEDLAICQFKKTTVMVNKAGKLIVRAEKGDHKIANKSVLLKCVAGDMKEVSEGEKASEGETPKFLFNFESSNALVVDAADEKQSVKSISTLIKAAGAAKLFAHAQFPKASPPPKFTRKKAFHFVPSDPAGTEARALQAGHGASRVRPMWVVGPTSEDPTKLIPKGVALVATASIQAGTGDTEL